MPDEHGKKTKNMQKKLKTCKKTTKNMQKENTKNMQNEKSGGAFNHHHHYSNVARCKTNFKWMKKMYLRST